MQGKEGKATRMRRTFVRRSEGRPQPRRRPAPKSPREKCPRQGSNLYAVSDTGPSNQPVYQFQHVGPNQLNIPANSHARGGTRTLTRLTPTGS